VVKSHIRDYATAAFRFYAMAGPASKYKQLIWNDAIERHRKTEGNCGVSDSTGAAVQRAQEALDRAAADIQDLEAVELTISAIEQLYGGRDMMTALRMVYMTDPSREPDRGEISERVHAAEIQIPASERSIYGWLSYARKLFAEIRGLRI
jgi:hypothetical protein